MSGALHASSPDSGGRPDRVPRPPHGATQAPEREAVRRLSELFGEASQILADLAETGDIQLAAGADPSLIQPMPLDPLKSEAPARREADDPTLMAPGELAEVLQCHPRTVRRMELAGELPPSIKKGRLKRWNRREIQEWLAARPSPRSGRMASL